MTPRQELNPDYFLSESNHFDKLEGSDLKSTLKHVFQNIERINEEHRIVKENNFPLFFSPQQKFEKFNLENETNLYVPKDLSGCWAIKTPCVFDVKNTIGVSVEVDKKWGFIIFRKK